MEAWTNPNTGHRQRSMGADGRGVCQGIHQHLRQPLGLACATQAVRHQGSPIRPHPVDGIEIPPPGTAARAADLPDTGLPGQAPFTLGASGVGPDAGWHIRFLLNDPDASASAADALTDLENGPPLCGSLSAGPACTTSAGQRPRSSVTPWRSARPICGCSPLPTEPAWTSLPPPRSWKGSVPRGSSCSF